MTLNNSEVSYLLSKQRVDVVRNAWDRFNLELGLPGIDKQHLWLLAILLDLETLVTEQKGQKPELNATEFDRAFHRLLGELIDYSVEHFALEEEFLRRIQFPGFSAHKRQHTRFIAGIRLRMRSLRQKTPESLLADAEKLLTSLRKWLLHHILSEDRAYTDELFQNAADPAAGAEQCENILRDLGINLRIEQERLYKLVRSPANSYETEARTTTQANPNPNPLAAKPNIIRWVAGLWHAYQLQLGIPIIDMQHLWLIKLIAELEAAERDREIHPVDDSEVQKRFQAAITEVQNYVAEHFSTEEALMQEFHFPGFPSHVRQHQEFAESVSARINEAESGNSQALHNLVSDLKQWLIAHIAVEDRRIYYFLRRRLGAVNELVRKLAAENRLKLRPGYLELYNEIIHFRTN